MTDEELMNIAADCMSPERYQRFCTYVETPRPNDESAEWGWPLALLFWAILFGSWHFR